MHIPLREWNADASILQGLVYHHVASVESLEIFFGRHPVTHTQINGRISESFNADLRWWLTTDIVNVSQGLLDYLCGFFRIILVADADGSLDNFVGKRIVQDFTDNVFVGYGDDLVIFGGENCYRQVDFVNHTADTVDGDCVPNHKWSGQDDDQSGTVIGYRASNGETGTESECA